MPNTKTRGKIRINGVAVSGLRVEAYDQDYLLGIPTVASKLGSTYTDSNGEYTISYAANDYGEWITDEDRIQTSPDGAWPKTYAAANPDLYIEVYQGNTKIKTSDIKKDITEDTCRIDLDIEQDPQGERNLGETIVDGVSDGFNWIVHGIATIVEHGGEIIGAGLDSVFGEGSGNFTRDVSSGSAGAIRNWENNRSNAWENQTNRTVPMPEDLWESVKERYKNYKRDLLLRHFFSPDRQIEHQKHERAIPYLISSNNLIGFVNKNRIQTCDGLGRYNAAEVFPLEPLMKPELENVVWSSKDWRSHLIKNGDIYAREYENGLAYNGTFIACLAHEYALANANTSSSSSSLQEYRDECQQLITLALDAVEDLHRRTNMDGYIIRYYENGDCSGYDREGSEPLMSFPYEQIVEEQNSEISVSTEKIHQVLFPDGNPLSIPNESPKVKVRKDRNWIVYYNEDKVFLLLKSKQDDIVNVYRCIEKFCGFERSHGYCFPMTTEEDNVLDLNKELRLRRYEPSGDEYINLLEGLSVAYEILPKNSNNHQRIKELVRKINHYLLDNFYYIIRPCGNFAARGAYLSTYELPLSYMFNNILNTELSEMSSVEIRDILLKAELIEQSQYDDMENLDDAIKTEQIIKIILNKVHSNFGELITLLIDILGLHSINVKDRWLFVYHILAQIHTGKIEGILTDEKNGEINQKLGLIIYENSIMKKLLNDNLFSLLQVWTIEMLAKASIIGNIGVAKEGTNEEISFHEVFEFWFDTVGDIKISAGGNASGYAHNPITIATYITLTGKKTNYIWEKLDFFFKSDRSMKESSKYPLDHIKMEITNFYKDKKKTEFIGCKGKELAGEYSLMGVMWPIVTIAHSLGQPLDASIMDFNEENGLLNNLELKNILNAAIENREE